MRSRSRGQPRCAISGMQYADPCLACRSHLIGHARRVPRVAGAFSMSFSPVPASLFPPPELPNDLVDTRSDFRIVMLRAVSSGRSSGNERGWQWRQVCFVFAWFAARPMRLDRFCRKQDAWRHSSPSALCCRCTGPQSRAVCHSRAPASSGPLMLTLRDLVMCTGETDDY